jgi:hypothetical protein
VCWGVRCDDLYDRCRTEGVSGRELRIEDRSRWSFPSTLDVIADEEVADYARGCVCKRQPPVSGMRSENAYERLNGRASGQLGMRRGVARLLFGLESAARIAPDRQRAECWGTRPDHA